MPLTVCPSCESKLNSPFYSQQQIPAHSVLLMNSREDAVNYPRGDLAISMCDSCGFITNTLFDVSLNDYNPDYEETQHFSACFNSFAQQLVTRLIDSYDIRNKTVLEIGCGKGEFLVELCEQGNNRGIGVDPGCRPERLDDTVNERVEFICELYTEEHAALQADVIVCRHTLEHIHPVKEFVSTIRRSLEDNPNAIVVIEVPDVEIVLRERRFWDVYYEHCSYFTAETLCDLFERERFEILECVREYDDQYLVMVARPVPAPVISESRGTFVDEIRSGVTSFENQVGDDIKRWDDTLRRWKASGGTTAIWGGGSKCVSFLSTVEAADNVDVVVDINPHKAGKFIPGSGHRVISPTELIDYAPSSVVAMNSIYLSEIQQQLAELGLAPELVGL